jgi:hypothetical protein
LYPQDEEDSANVHENAGIDTRFVDNGRVVPDFERSQEVESRMISESPYATPPNIHEVSEFDTADSTELQSKDNEVISTANPKSALKRRLADVTSLGEVADSHSATPFFWHVPKVSQNTPVVIYSYKIFRLLYRSSIAHILRYIPHGLLRPGVLRSKISIGAWA